MALEFRFPRPDVPWSQNKTEHWAKTSKRKKAWKEATYYAIQKVIGVNRLKPSYVQVSIPFDANRRRDPHNYTGTVVKAMVDGMVMAGAWKDDTAEYVTILDPILTVGETVVVTITPYDEGHPNAQH